MLNACTRNAARVAAALQKAGYGIAHKNFFDTVVVEAPGAADELVAKALDAGVNIRRFALTAWVSQWVSRMMMPCWGAL